MSYGLLVEVRGNSEEVISVVTFLTLFEKNFGKMGVGDVKVKAARKTRWGFLRGRIREIAVEL